MAIKYNPMLPIPQTTLRSAPTFDQLVTNRLARQAGVRKPPMPMPQGNMARDIDMARQKREMQMRILQAQAAQAQKQRQQVQPQQQQKQGGFQMPSAMSPAGQALGAAAATGLQLSGYSTMPRTFGQNIGAMMASADKAYTDAQDRQQKAKLEELQLGLAMAKASKPDLTTLQQNLIAAGYDLSSEEGQAAMRHQLEKSDAQTIFLGGDAQKELAYKNALETRKGMVKQVNLDRELGTRLQQVIDLISGGAETGRIQSATMGIRQIAREMGFLSDEQIGELTDQEIIDSAASFLTPRMRVVGSGASSDRDMDFFARATVRMANTPQANLVIASMQKQVMNYNRDRLDLFDKFVAKFGNDFGFGSYADEQLGNVYKRVETDEDFTAFIENGKIKEGDVFYNAITKEFDIYNSKEMG